MLGGWASGSGTWSAREVKGLPKEWPWGQAENSALLTAPSLHHLVLLDLNMRNIHQHLKHVAYLE